MSLPMQEYVEKLPSTFPRHLLLAGRWLGDTAHVYEVAWPYPLILEDLAALEDEFYAILGGDVYREESGHFIFANDTWGLNADPAWTWLDYVQRSHKVSRDYIERYHSRNGDGFWYVPVFSS